MVAWKLIHFLSHPVAFGFWASTPLHNIVLNYPNKKTDITLEMKQVMS